MMNTKKRWLAALLSVVMVVAMLPSMAFAANPTLSNVKIDDKGVITWDAVKKADGTFENTPGVYAVKTVVKEDGAVNPGDWNKEKVALSGAVTFVKGVVDGDTAKAVLTGVDKVTVKETLEVTITRTVEGEPVMESVVTLRGKAPVADEKKLDAVNKVELEASTEKMDGLKVTITPESSSAKNVATSFELSLYKNTVALTNPQFVPSTATLVKTVKVPANGTAAVTYDFDGVDFAYDAAKEGAKNHYFVAVKGQRAGFTDSDVLYSASNEASTAKKLEDSVGSAATFTNAYTGNVLVGNKASTAALKYEVYVQVKAYPNGDNVGEAIKLEGTTDNAQTTTVAVPSDKLKEVIKKDGKYFLEATVKLAGCNPVKVYSASQEYLVMESAKAVTALTMNHEGAITEINKENTSETYRYEVLYKGKIVKVCDKVVLEAFNLANEWSAFMTSGTPAVTTKNLKDFAIKVYGSATGKLDADVVTLSCLGKLDAPKAVAWENAKGDKAVATWEAVKNAKSYLVYITDAYDPEKKDTYVITTETKADLTKLLKTAGSKSFTVVAMADNYEKSDAVQSTKPDFDFKVKLEDVKNAKWNGNLATWDKVLDADSYTIKKIVNGKQVGPDCKTTATSYQFKGLSKPGAYEFIVIANSAREGFLSSNAVTSDVKYIEGAKVGTPYITSASKTRTTVKLRWTAAEKAQVYRIYYKTKGMDSYKMIVKSVRGDATAKTIKGLKKGTRYSFKVKAVNSGAAAYSNVKVVTTTK